MRTVGMITVVFWITVAILVVVEGVMALAGGRDGGTTPFLINLARLRGQGSDRRGHIVSDFDPHLAYGYGDGSTVDLRRDPVAPPRPGDPPDYQAVAHGGLTCLSEDRPFRIVTLGGSTTDVAVFNGNWPWQLQRILDAQGLPVTVCNGGVVGYTTNEGLLKLIRDVLPWHPDLVVTYDGVNEPDRPFPDKLMIQKANVSMMARVVAMTRATLFPTLSSVLGRAWTGDRRPGIAWGADSRLDPVGQWERNLRLMEAICRQQGIAFLAVLQPIHGIGSPAPEAVLRQLREEGETDFYEGAMRRVGAIPFAADLTGILDTMPQVYLDRHHVDAVGNRRIADGILDEITRRGLMSAGRSD